jgi:hypothetical protein
MDYEFPILDEENYSTWRIEMRVNLKEMGPTIWKASIVGSVSLKNKSKGRKEECCIGSQYHS